MNIFDYLFDKAAEMLYKVLEEKSKIELRILSKKQSITFNEHTRQRYLQMTKHTFQELQSARERGNVDDGIIAKRDVMVNLHRPLAEYASGYGSAKVEYSKGNDGAIVTGMYIDRDDLESRVFVKKFLELGADTRVLYFPVYEDDDFESIERLTLNGLLRGVKLIPLINDDENRDESVSPSIDPVFFTMQEIYDQTFTLGELATLYAFKPNADIIAMLIRADADFTVRRNRDPEGVHAFIRAFQDDFGCEDGYRKDVLDAYKNAYLCKYNKLSSKQRHGIVELMQECVDENSPHAQSISDQNKHMINKALDEMLGNKTSVKTLETEKQKT